MIVVAGYPRSGNVWMARLLGDVLDRRVVGIGGGDGTLAAEGKDRNGNGQVMQAHVYPAGPVRGPGEKDTFFRENLQVDLDRLNGRQVVLMVRDPRDVAVSVAEFWGWSMDRALHNMIVGPGPLHLPPWAAYMKRWLGHADIRTTMKYLGAVAAEGAEFIDRLTPSHGLRVVQGGGGSGSGADSALEKTVDFGGTNGGTNRVQKVKSSS